MKSALNVRGCLALFLAVSSLACDGDPKPTGKKIALKLNLQKGDRKTATPSNDLDSRISGNAPLRVDLTCTLYDRKDGLAIVKIDGESGGTNKGSLSGMMKIDEKTGWTRDAGMKLDFSAEQQGMTMKTSATMKITGS